MKKLGAAVVAVLALAGLAMAGVPLLEERIATEIKQDIERQGRGSVGAVEVGLFERRLMLRDVRLKGTDDVRIGRVEATGLAWPLQELLQGRTPLSGFQLGDPLQARRVEIANFHVLAASTIAHLEALSIEGFDLERYDAGTVGDSQYELALAARVARALSVRRLDFRGLALKSVAGDSVSVATFSVRDAERGLIGKLQLGDIAIASSAMKTPAFRLSDTTVGGFDLRRPLEVLASGDWAVGAPLGRAHIANASLTGFSGELLQQYGISLGAMTHETVAASSKVMRSRGRIEGLVIAPPARGGDALQLRLAMAAMDLNEIKLGLECGGVEDREKGELVVDRCVLTGTDLGEVGLTARVAGADETFWRLIDGEDSSDIESTTAAFVSATLSLADKGLLERLLKGAAIASGQEFRMMRAALAEEVRRFQPSNILITENLTKLLDIVASFIERGGTLTIEAKPDQPLGIDKLGYLQSPGPDLVGVLGLSAKLTR